MSVLRTRNFMTKLAQSFSDRMREMGFNATSAAAAQTVQWESEHREKLNVLFMDGMVQSISPKELWRLKWHKKYDTSAPLPEWPEWMASFKAPD